jgi:Protein of unknown function (DUF2924)
LNVQKKSRVVLVREWDRRLQRVMVLADGFAWSGQTYDSLSKVLYRHACLMGLEGLVSKHRDRPYRAGPSRHWIKVKNPKVAGNAF